MPSTVMPGRRLPLLRRLSTKFLVSVFAILAPTVAAMVLVAGYLGEDGLRAAARAGLERSALEKRAAIEAWSDAHRNDITLLASARTLQEAVADAGRHGTGWTSVRRLLLSRLGVAGDFTELFVVDARSGRVMAATGSTATGGSRVTRPYFVEGRRRPFVQPVYYSSDLGGAAMTAAAPVLHPGSSTVVAVLAGRLDLSVLQTILNRGVDRSSNDAFLVNPSGEFVSQPRFARHAAVFRITNKLPDVFRCLRGTSGYSEAPDYRGVDALKVLTWMPEMQSCLVVKIDRSEAFVPAHALTRQLSEAGLVSGTAGLGVALLFTASIARRLRPVRLGLEALRQGDRRVRIGHAGHDELGELAAALDRAAEAISDSEARLLEHARLVEAANAELDAFAYSVSHDLRAPLRAINGFSQSVSVELGDEVAPRVRSDLDRICRAAGHMGELIDDLLQLARISRATLVPQQVDVSALVRAVAAALAEHDTARPVAISVEDGMTVEADPALLRIVFENLLGNAWKFTRTAEQPEIRVESVAHDGVIDLSVRDNGTGFDQAYAHKLFQPFERLHPSADYEGSGIGLATVQRIVTRHGGTAQATGGPGRGATFTITLPRRAQ